MTAISLLFIFAKFPDKSGDSTFLLVSLSMIHGKGKGYWCDISQRTNTTVKKDRPDRPSPARGYVLASGRYRLHDALAQLFPLFDIDVPRNWLSHAPQ